MYLNSAFTARRLLTSLLLLVLAATHALADTQRYLGIYYNGKKIGWVRIASSSVTHNGKPAVSTVSVTRIAMQLLGNSVQQDVTSTTISDTSSRPLVQEHSILSNGSSLKVKAVYGAGEIRCTVDSGGGPTTKVVSIPPGAVLMGDTTLNRVEGLKKPGDRQVVYALNPLTLILDRMEMSIEGEVTVKYRGAEVRALRSLAVTPFGSLRSWESLDGNTIYKGEMPVGMAMYSEDSETALNMKSTAPSFSADGTDTPNTPSSAGYNPTDIGMSTAIRIEPPLPNPRSLKRLVLNISGAELTGLPPNDLRQKTSETGSGRQFEITAARFDAAKSAKLPIRNPAVARYQASAPYLEITDPEIRRTAATLKGTETNAYRVALKINNWIHKQMKPDYSIGVPRSCKDVLTRRQGVCRDYATLFAGLARSAGIPTRVAGGIVYAEGRFFYHAWVECWVGAWVPFDATMGGEFVDATHVKLAQGEVTEMYQSANAVGRLQVKVLEAN